MTILVFVEKTMEEKKEVGLICCGIHSGNFRTGHVPWNKGKVGVQSHSEKTRKQMSLKRKGSKHPNWKGGKFVRVRGYIASHQPNHHFADSKGYVMEHRLVWEEYYKACLLSWVDIHHKNGITNDNRIENLEAMMHGKHTTLTNKGVRHGPRSDVANRLCYQCNRPTYYDKKKGYFMWYKDLDGNYICRKCSRLKRI